MKTKVKAINLFVKHTKYDAKQIMHIEQIHDGFTNVSYKLTTQDKATYQVRVGNNEVIHRQNEHNVLKLIKNNTYIYFNVQSGDAIKKWIPGSNPTHQQVCSSTFLKTFARALIKLHNTNTDKQKILKHDYLDCLKKAQLPPQHRTVYLSLMKRFQNLPLVLSHNDLSAENLIYTPDHQVIFIDYEWSRLNNQYWDVANFIREVDLPINKIKELASYLKIKNTQSLLELVYLSTNYAYQWTFNMPMNLKIKKYRGIVFKKMTRYLSLIN